MAASRIGVASATFGARQGLEGRPPVRPGVVVLKCGAQHAFVVSDPADGPADEEAAELGEIGVGQPLVFRHPGQPAFAITRGKRHQRIEIGVLALEPAVEGADGGADLTAQCLDRQFRKAVRPQHLRAGPEQGGHGLAAALLPRRGHAGEVEFSRSLHPELASPFELIIMIIRIMVFGNARSARCREPREPLDQPRSHPKNGRKA